MKKQDITLIVIVVIFSSVFSFVIASLTITAPRNRQVPVEVVYPITNDFPAEDKRYFNENSINPTQNITIGNGANANPL